jgi:hypothetical protein
MIDCTSSIGTRFKVGGTGSNDNVVITIGKDGMLVDGHSKPLCKALEIRNVNGKNEIFVDGVSIGAFKGSVTFTDGKPHELSLKDLPPAKPPVVEAPKPTSVPQFETSFGGNQAFAKFASDHGIQCPVGTTVQVVGNQYWLYSFGSECKFGNINFISNDAGVGVEILGKNGGWTTWLGGPKGEDAADITTQIKTDYDVVGNKYAVDVSGERAYQSRVLAIPKGK